MKKKYTYFLLIGFTFLAIPVQAAVVYLKDGTELRGTIVNATAADIQIYTGQETTRVATDRISRIDYEDKPSATVPPSAPPPPAQDSLPPRRRAQYLVFDEPARGGDERNMFSLNLGLAVPLSNVNFASAGGGSGDNGDAGFLIGTQYIYSHTPRFGSGIDFEYFHRSATDSRSLLPSADTDVFGDTLLLMGIIRYTPVNRGWTRPFILAGLGTNRTSTVIDATPVPGFSWSDTDTAETRTLVDDTHWGLASTVRLGFDFHFQAPEVFTLEFGWTGLSNNRYQATSAGQNLGLSSVTGTINVMTITGRWGWRF